MGIYRTVSDRFIKDRLPKNLFNSLYTPCYNLSCILGDTDGLINRGLATSTIQNLDLTSPGLIILGQYIIDSTTRDVEGNVLPIDEYYPQVSNYAYLLYRQMVNKDHELIIDKGNSYSPLIDLSVSALPPVRLAINAVYLDSLAIYKEMLSTTSPSSLSCLTSYNFDRVLSNLRWIGSELELDPLPSYSLIQVVRDLQRSIATIRTVSEIFHD